MDRQSVYPGAIPLETDLLNTNKYAMIGLAKLSAALMGSSTYFNGLACTPTSPASMSVQISPGEIYSLQNIDGTAYSSLPADTTHSILKQGLLQDAITLVLAAPTTAGQSINYLVQIAYQDVDGGSTVLPYYNASNPPQAWSGPNNTGEPQSTVRSGICSVTTKAGVSATTGLQTTPPPDAGYIGAYVVTVANGQVTIVSNNISFAPNAPFLPSSGIVSGIQSGSLVYAADTGAVNSYAASYSPPITQLSDGVKVVFKAKTANTGASTFTVNGLTNYPLYSHSQQALQGGEIIANGLIEAEWSSSLTAWVMCGNSGGRVQVPSATQGNHAVNLSQLNSSTTGRLLAVRAFTASTAYTPTAGTQKIRIRCWGGGGGGGGTAAVSTTQAAIGGGGSAGSYGESFTSVSSFSIVIGAGGVSSSLGADGTNGGTTTAGGITATGGTGGAFGVANSVFPFGASPRDSSTASGGNVVNSPGATASMGFSWDVNGGIRSMGGQCSVGASLYSSNSTGYAAGGSGYAVAGGSGAIAATAGFNGAPGLVIIEEYA